MPITHSPGEEFSDDTWLVSLVQGGDRISKSKTGVSVNGFQRSKIAIYLAQLVEHPSGKR